jgi:hypothetical protein
MAARCAGTGREGECMTNTSIDYKDLYEGCQQLIKDLQQLNRELRKNLRDEMAMAAIPVAYSLIVELVKAGKNLGEKELAKYSYIVADAMITAREKQN